MDIFQMRLAISLARLGSFAKVGELHFASPQTVKNQIDALEHELGIQLFTRTSKGTVPTTLGEMFCRRAQSIVDSVDALTYDLGKLSERQGVYLGVAQHYTSSLRDYLCEAFNAQYPQIQFRYVVYDNAKKLSLVLQDDEANVSFYACPEEQEVSEGLQFHLLPLLPPMYFYLAVSKDNPISSKSHVAWNDVPFGENKPLVYKFDYLKRSNLSAVKELEIIEEPYAAISHCQEGGCCIVSNYSAFAHDSISFIPIDLKPLKLGLVTKGDPSEDVRTFVQFCQSCECPEHLMPDMEKNGAHPSGD